MTTLADRPKTSVIHALLWGEPKTGKTVLAHQWPRTRTLDLDNGMESVMWAIRKGPLRGKKKPEDIVYETVLEESRTNFGYVKKPEALERAVGVLKQWFSDKEYDKWDTLIIDSVTALGEICIDQALKNLGKLGSYTESKTRSDQVEMRIMARQDWGPAMSLLKNVIEECRTQCAGQKNLFVIAHEHQETNESGAVLGRKPYVIGKSLRNDIPRLFDEVWHIELDRDGTPVLYTKGSKRFEAGSRLGLPDEIKDPTYDKIMKAVA